MAALTKKHFKAIAEILRDKTDRSGIINSLCDYFATENPLFDRDRFLSACCVCGVDGEGEK